MAIYRVEMMTTDDYYRFMTGPQICFVSVETVEVEAETKEEAVAKVQAEYPDMVVNKYARTLEQIEAEKQAEIEAEKAERKAEAERKARAEAREKAKAEEMGLTVAELKEYKKAKTNMKRHETEIRKAYEEIEKMKAKIKYEERKVEEYRKEMEKYER